ncbi:metallophosphoesterase [Nocardioides luteus]|uniref:Metallophosphoesterase n=1 Tax=Nocardioides luteus TaxID=1844 RepID=A0A1J4N2Z7_9ACTN|nr:metallophosphoesterase [Nocardioides luteus]
MLWLVLTVGSSALLFLSSERPVVLAGHDSVLRPTLSGKAIIHTGPVLPDVRLDVEGPIGVDVTLGKTELRSMDELFERYAVLGSAPDGQRAVVVEQVESMLVAAVIRGAAISLAIVAGGVLLWWLPGAQRRADLRRRVAEAARTRHGLTTAGVGAVTVAVLAVAVWQPWGASGAPAADKRSEPVAGDWTPLARFLGTEIPVPDELADVEVRGDAYAIQTRRLVASAVDTYNSSRTFYEKVVDKVPDLALREPAEDETVAVVVSDRHDNVGMDSVVRAIADEGGATGILDAGDDTSTGSDWETFSLDSLTDASDGLDKWAVTGNHDHGPTVGRYLADKGWTMLDGEVVDGPGGSTLLGVPDPRTSGLGNWIDEKGVSFEEAGSKLADIACASMDDGKPVATLLVHDPSLGRETLRRGCATLVVGGHRHVHLGPRDVTGENGQVGWTYTNGTTGGAAYAFAMGKIRRTAEVSLITYADGQPVGIQSVELETNGALTAHEYVPLEGADR